MNLPVGVHKVMCCGEWHEWEVLPHGGIRLLNHVHRDELVAEQMGGDLPICSDFLQTIKQSPWYWSTNRHLWTTEMRQLLDYISFTRQKRRDSKVVGRDPYLDKYDKLVSFPRRYTDAVLVPAARKLTEKTRYRNRWGGGYCNFSVAYSSRPSVWEELVEWCDEEDCIGVGIDLAWSKVLKRGIAVVDGYFVTRLEEEHPEYWRVQAGYQNPNTGNMSMHKAHIRRPSLELVWEPFTATY